jgi:hypothetical protein
MASFDSVVSHLSSLEHGSIPATASPRPENKSALAARFCFRPSLMRRLLVVDFAAGRQRWRISQIGEA